MAAIAGSGGGKTLSIPAWFDWRLPVRPLSHLSEFTFNPSLVRLALAPNGNYEYYFTDFQSQLGSIGAPPQAPSAAPPAAPFNPSLVRLARQIIPSTSGASNLSIPAWFDWRGGEHGACSPNAALSIPAWFDWRGLELSGFAIERHFQSQLGSIGAERPVVLIAEGLPFQSQLGSIGASRNEKNSNKTQPLSIPAWFDWRLPTGRPGCHQHPAFNPSLVRLAREEGRREGYDMLTFNPSLVRLALVHHPSLGVHR